ncbi:anaphase-promoting complex, cyclosome, subunit 4-domain-containing protein [Zychaea mexicana]|uniref:anaphase-promoting complex, cyclosome, subunit 4-domain-containing protein n=1 Tax=Zychaea mexicana TaxID=64656 RepID=UPI0022FDF311|nr:anaphase-promoting complex, cyclosome, subunit 4-domain-containing protein [Zychaea mexicana]KAI9497478.1 anaphase-promoting complex, cyclosome, subunit 4-domain-containing protein [Zychaea mexicana]
MKINDTLPFSEQSQFSFPMFHSKNLKKQAKQITWCPTQDLAAIVFADNTIALCRDGWFPIWEMNASDGADITALAWNPNGEEFAIGFSNGTVRRVNATCAQPKWIVYTLPPIPSSSSSSTTTLSTSTKSSSSSRSGNLKITSLAWTHFPRKEDKPVDTMYGFDPKAMEFTNGIPALKMEPPDEPAPLAPFMKQKKPPLPDQPSKESEDKHTLLLVGDNHGRVHLSLNGTYHIGTMSVRADGKAKNKEHTVVSTCTGPTLSTIQVLVQKSPEKRDMLSMDSSILLSKRNELCNIAEEQKHVDFLLRYINQCVNLLNKHHTTIRRLAEQSSGEISRLLLERNSETDPMPQIELLGLIATGNTSEPVHAYFTQYLTDQQVKRWESRSHQSYGNLQRLVNEYLEPACSRLLHRLNRLRGYSLWTERYSELLDTSVIDACIDTAQLLLKRLIFYRISVDKVCLEFREFIKWTLHMIEKLADQNGGEYQNHPDAVAYDPWLVVNFIKKSFATDGLTEYFTVYPGIERSDERWKHTGFLQLVNTLTEMCNTMLDRPSSIISNQTSILQKNTVQFKDQPIQRKSARSFASWVAEEEAIQFYAFARENDRGTILTVVKKSLKEPYDVSYASGRLENVLIHDIEFLDSQELGLVIESVRAARSFLATTTYPDLSYTTPKTDVLVLGDTLARVNY